MENERIIPEPEIEPGRSEEPTEPGGAEGALSEFRALLEEARAEGAEGGEPGEPGEPEEPEEPGEPEHELALAIWRQVSRTGAVIDPVFELSPAEVKDLAGPTARVLKKYEVMLGGAGASMPPELALAIAMIMIYGPRVFVYMQNRRHAKRDLGSSWPQGDGKDNLDQDAANPSPRG